MGDLARSKAEAGKQQNDGAVAQAIPTVARGKDTRDIHVGKKTGCRCKLPAGETRNGMIAPRRQLSLHDQITKEGARSDGNAFRAAAPMRACPIKYEAADRLCCVDGRIISEHRNS